jgi:hypothetical protein
MVDDYGPCLYSTQVELSVNWSQEAWTYYSTQWMADCRRDCPTEWGGWDPSTAVYGGRYASQLRTPAHVFRIN